MMRNYKRGFTIVELALSMTFISVLLLSIVLVSVQIGRTYNKGLVIKQINESSRSIDNTLRRDFLASDHRHISGGGSDAVIMLRDGGRTVSGRFCLGYYSYLWNTPEAIDQDWRSSGVVLASNNQPISFVRVVDVDGKLCQTESGGVYRTSLNSDDEITHLLQPKSTRGNSTILAIYDFAVSPVVLLPDEPEGLYRISFTLGTSKIREINTANQSCKPPKDEDSNLNFCSINKFDTIVRTNG